MHPYLIGQTYYVRFSYLQKQYRFSLGTSNLKNATLIADQIERGINSGAFDSFDKGFEAESLLKIMIARPGLRVEEAKRQIDTAEKMTRLKEAIQHYLENCKTEHSPSNYINEVRVFNRFGTEVKCDYVHQVTPEAIERWRNNRMIGVSKPTVNRELKMIKRFFKQCVEKGQLIKSPAQSIKIYREPERAIRHFSDDEIKRLLASAPEDLRRVITFLLLTGLRYGELCNLEWSDIDFRRKQIIIQPKANWNPKNFKKRILPMHPLILDVLSSQQIQENTSYIFPDSSQKNATKGLRNRIYRVFENAKVKGNVKDLRSTFASNAVMSGLPIYTVSKLLGHHDVKITEKHYAHLAPDYMGNVITMLKLNWNPKPVGGTGFDSPKSITS